MVNKLLKVKKYLLFNLKFTLKLKIKKTGTDYASEEEAKLDISNPNTATTSDDVETNVQIKVTKLPDVFGKTKND